MLSIISVSVLGATLLYHCIYTSASRDGAAADDRGLANHSAIALANHSTIPPMPRLVGRAALLTAFRRMPTANAEGSLKSQGSIGKLSVRCVLRYLQVDRGPRAFAVGMLREIEKKTLGPRPARSAIRRRSAVQSSGERTRRLAIKRNC